MGTHGGPHHYGPYFTLRLVVDMAGQVTSCNPLSDSAAIPGSFARGQSSARAAPGAVRPVIGVASLRPGDFTREFPIRLLSVMERELSLAVD